jgi:excisionase family DNA binding protein
MESQTIDEKFSLILAELQSIKRVLSLHNSAKEIEMYTIKEACEKLNLSRTTFDRYRKDGKIVVSKVMGKNYVTSQEIKTYLDGN